MTVRLNTNQASMNAQRRLGEVSSSLSKTFERLSSGLRISRASDDAAGLAVASNLNVDARVFAQGYRNINDGVSAVQIADGALQELGNVVTRITELAEQSSNGVISSTQRQALDKEAQALRNEYNRIVSTTSFNNRALFGSQAGDLSVQAGYGDANTLTLNLDRLFGTLGNDGTFSNTQTLPNGTNVSVKELADFNGDGVLDFVTGGASNNRWVWFGNGDGTFKSGSFPSAGGWVSGNSLEVGDLDGDGDIDMLQGFQGGTDIRYLLNDGSGTSWTAITLAAPYEISDIRLADFNGDGRLDIYATSQDVGSSGSLYLNTGGGTFGARISTVGQRSFGLIVDDFNNDGFADVGYGDTGPNFIVQLGNGNATFKAPVVSTGNITSTSLATDFNGDGNLDLVQTGTNGLRVSLGAGNGSFASSYYVVLGDTRDASVGDFNGDGLTDILTTRDDAYENIHLFLGNGNGTFLAPTSLAPLGWASVDVGDFDGNGTLDILTTDHVALGGGSATPILEEFSLATQASAKEALDQMKLAIQSVSSGRAKLGGFLSRLNTAATNISTLQQNYLAAASQILDADVAIEAAELTRKQILQSSAQAVLSQANQLPQLALRLLQGGF